MPDNLQQRIENLGPAERVIQTLLAHADHMVHNRPGYVTPAPGTVGGVRWEPVTHKVEEGQKVVYRLVKQGKKNTKVRVGVMGDDLKIREGGRIVGEYRRPGLFPEIAAWMYQQVAEVWKLDNEFAARWASFAFAEEHRDLKVVLCAFMLVQNRRGDPVRENGEILFHDEDYRAVGEAMCLIRRPDGKDLNPKLLLRVGELLRLPQIADINRALGFGKSAKNPALGRWPDAVRKWLRHREQNPKMLAGLVKAGFRTTVMELSRSIGYKPATETFYATLRWKQKQSPAGHRRMAIGVDVTPAESWVGLTEAEICQRIVDTKPSWKRIAPMIPTNIGVSRAIVAAAVEAGAMSNADLIILTPTLEDLGLLTVEPVKSRWETAIREAENQRAANIAARVKNKETQDALHTAAETAVKKAVEEVVKGLVIYFMIDISGSMQNALEQSKDYLVRLLGGFPLDKLRVAVFNDVGRVVTIKHPSKAGVEAALRGFQAGGGTAYGEGVRALQDFKPGPDEDALFIFVGDQDPDHPRSDFSARVRQSGLNPVAFGLLEVTAGHPGDIVERTAVALQIPCFRIDAGVFNDPYSIPRTLRNLIAATPVGKLTPERQIPRFTLVERILKTDLLAKPVWAA